MRTPSGKDCKFFYGDYFRGRNIERCSLIAKTGNESEWSSEMCTSCPVPSILLANSCKHMILSGKITRRFIFFKPQITISAYCDKTLTHVKNPHIGCGECHKLPPIHISGDENDNHHAY